MITATFLEREAIEALIPHREPFLLVDQVTDIDPGISLTAFYEVPEDLDVFRGHFPNFPIFPGVLIVEHMAQAACVLMNYTDQNSESSKVPVLAKVENCSFNGMVRPGDIIESHVSLDREVGAFTIFAVKAHVGGKRVAKCNLVVSTAAIK